MLRTTSTFMILAALLSLVVGCKARSFEGESNASTSASANVKTDETPDPASSLVVIISGN